MKNNLLSEEYKVTRSLFDARTVAGSARYINKVKQYEIALSLRCLLLSEVSCFVQHHFPAYTVCQYTVAGCGSTCISTHIPELLCARPDGHGGGWLFKIFIIPDSCLNRLYSILVTIWASSC